MAPETGADVSEHWRDDEVASRTSWDPLQPTDGANYRTRSANRISDSRIVFDPSLTSKLVVWAVIIFVIVCLIIGTVVTVLWLTGAIDDAEVEGDPWILKFVGPGFLVGAVFFGGLGLFLRGKLLKPIVFDRQAGLHWRGSGTPAPGNQKALALDEIHALQILEKWVKQSGPDTGGYTSYELNLVTGEGERRNVIDHSELDAIQSDAGQLGAFLNVPLWDTTLE